MANSRYLSFLPSSCRVYLPGARNIPHMRPLNLKQRFCFVLHWRERLVCHLSLSSFSLSRSRSRSSLLWASASIFSRSLFISRSLSSSCDFPSSSSLYLERTHPGFNPKKKKKTNALLFHLILKEAPEPFFIIYYYLLIWFCRINSLEQKEKNLMQFSAGVIV